MKIAYKIRKECFFFLDPREKPKLHTLHQRLLETGAGIKGGGGVRADRRTNTLKMHRQTTEDNEIDH